MDIEILNKTDNSYFINPLEVLDRIELRFDERRAIAWMNAHWMWSFAFSAIYLVLVFGGQKIMANREKFNLRRELCMWSTGLSVFSFYAIYKVAPMAYQMVYLGGWQHAVCDSRSYVGSAGGGVWAFLFPLSKLPELVDTAFIILRKQKMVFLHWYHHISVFIYCWYSYAFPISTGIWFGVVNYAVHALMYAYYAVKASGRNPPRWVAQGITTIQLSQMFVGIFLNYMATRALLNNKQCLMTPFEIGLSIFFYVSYAILFGNFFYWTYIHKRSRKTDQTSKVTEHIESSRMGLNDQVTSGLDHVANGSSHVTNGIPHAKATITNGNGLTPNSTYNLRSRKN